MTIAYWCVLITMTLPYICSILAKASTSGYSNSEPRDFLSKLEGWGARANAAQQNSFEITPIFSSAVIIANQIGTIDLTLLDQLAILFVASRILYIGIYIANWATLRSLVWFIGCATSISMLVLSI